MNINNNIN